MMHLPTNHWLYQLKAEILKIEPTAQLILYGSRARGEAKPDSDWDLLLLTAKTHISFEETMKLRRPFTLLELETGEILSLQVYNQAEWKNKYYFTPYYENIQKDGILL